MNNTYRFVLTPLDKVFFGVEKSPFTREEYYLQSRYFPQQTTLLGFLRHWLLLQSGQISQSRSTWDTLIGSESFNASTGQTFGTIQRISPLSIYQKTPAQDLYFARDSGQLQLQAAPGKVQISFGAGEKPSEGFALFSNEKEYYQEKDYKYFNEYLTDFNGNTHKVEDKKQEVDKKAIFIKDVKPGITKNYAGEAKTEGYFKVEYYRMKAGFAYSFLAAFDANTIHPNWLEPTFMRFGGDSSMVRVEVQPADSWENFQGTGNIFVALCDAAVSNDIYEDCQAWVTDTLPFRNMRTTTQDKDFSRRPSRQWFLRNATQLNANESRVLLKRGSILIANDATALQAKLTNPVFETIGYNHFTRLPQLP